jgi:hypothetical protein
MSSLGLICNVPLIRWLEWQQIARRRSPLLRYDYRARHIADRQHRPRAQERDRDFSIAAMLDTQLSEPVV